MRGFIIILALLVLFSGLAAQTVLTCAQVQTPNTGDTTGNSPYNGQTVTVQGIVTHVIPNSAFYIGDAGGGPWSGLYVYDRNTSNAVALGDLVKLTGKITEYYNLTEMVEVLDFQIISQDNDLPTATNLQTNQIAYNSSSSEQWEGVLVRVTDVQVKSTVDSYGQFKIADVSNGQAMVDNGLYSFPSVSIVVNDWWYRIQGIVDYHSAAGYKINPRNSSDMVKQDILVNSMIRIPRILNGVVNQQSTLNVYTSHIKLDWDVPSYSMTIKIDPIKVIFQGFETAGTLTPGTPDYTVSTSGEEITFSFAFSAPLVVAGDDSVLVKLIFEPLTHGEAIIDITAFTYGNVDINNLIDGKLITKIPDKIAYLNIGKFGDKKNIFNPFVNEIINITYGVKTGYLAKAVVRIYDAQGRLVHTPVHKNITSFTGFENYAWNGRDANLNLLPPGLYYCHLEVSDRSTGENDRTVQPIVIKSTLK